MPTPLTDADKVLRNDTGKDIASKLDDIKSAILGQSSTLNNLSDVAILSLGDGQFLKYDSSVGKWINVSLPDPPDTLADLTDTNITTPQNEDIIKYDSTSSKWKNVSSISEKSISNVPIASFSDGGDNIPVKTLKVLVSAVQSGSGTPSPDNVRAITGWSQAQITRTGKNLCPYLEQGQLSTTTGGEVASDTVRRSGFIRVEASQTYVFSNLSTSSTQTNKRLRVFYYDRWKTYINNETTELCDTSVNVTIPSGVSYIRFQASGTVLTETNAQVEKGSTPTTYEPYKGTTYTISLGSTVYGGTLDVTKDTLTVTHGYMSYSGGFSQATNGVFYIDGTVSDADTSSYNIVCLSNRYDYAGVKSATSGMVGQEDKFGVQFLQGLRIMVYDTSFVDDTAFNNSLLSTPLQVVYPLATPITIQLTPTEVKTILGQNNIFADCGDIQTLEYYTSVLDNTFDLMLTAFGNALILENIDGSIASFTCGTDLPLANCIVDVTPVIAGSGTPSPDNVRAISGWSGANVTVCGKNLFDKSQKTSGKYLASDGTETTSGSYDISNYIKCEGYEKVTVSGGSTSGNAPSICFYNAKKEFISGLEHSNHTFPYTYTIPSGTVYLRDSIAQTDVNTFQVELCASSSTYQAYNGITHTIQFGQTVYGGTLDVTKGVLTVTHQMDIFDGDVSENWSLASDGTVNRRFVLYGISSINAGTYKKSITNYLSWTTGTSHDWGTFTLGESTTYGFYIVVHDKSSNFADLATFKTYLSNNNLQLLTEMPTPVVVQLTPTEVKTILGQNNIFADCGNIHIKYFDTIRHKLT